MKLKVEISIIVRAIIEINYYSGDISRDDAIKYLTKMTHLNINLSNNMIKDNSAEHLMNGIKNLI